MERLRAIRNLARPLGALHQAITDLAPENALDFE